MKRSDTMRLLHLLSAGGIGGIEVLCREIGNYADFDNIFCFMFKEGEVFEQIKCAKQNVQSFAALRKISFCRLVQIVKLAKMSDIIVVHHDDPFLSLYYIALRLLVPKKKYMAMVHHCLDHSQRKWYQKSLKKDLAMQLMRLRFICSTKIVFVSEAGYRSYAEDHSLQKKKVSIIYNGISPQMIAAGADVNKETNDVIKLLYVGRLVETKGVNELLYAIKKIYTEYPIILSIVGDGPERAALEDAVAREGLDKCVRFLGFNVDVTPFLREADIFVYPTKTEIFGISVVEAMAYQCICIASNTGGIPEIISDHVNGLLVLEHSASGLATRIQEGIRICRDPEERAAMMHSAYTTAERFSVEKTINQLGELCRSLLRTERIPHD